jgi:hypothetical protein
MTGIGGEKVLYVGDHIYGDILRSRKASLWRTCMVVQELEDEIRYTEGRAEEISRLGEVEMLITRLDDEVNVRKGALNALERRLEREHGPERAALEAERKLAKSELERLAGHCGAARSPTSWSGTWSWASTPSGGCSSRKGTRTPASGARWSSTPVSTPRG